MTSTPAPTIQVLQRCYSTLIPTSIHSSYINNYLTPADLYGPFWTLTTLIFSLFVFSSLSTLATADLQNSTIDDQIFSRINYVQPQYWAHDPLIGWEEQFFNGSRSYTYTPGAYASFTFTGEYFARPSPVSS